MIAEYLYGIFVDNSGSVGGCFEYWYMVNTRSTTTAKTSRTTTSGTLDADCPPKSSLRSPSVLSKRGTGGTSPEYVA